MLKHYWDKKVTMKHGRKIGSLWRCTASIADKPVESTQEELLDNPRMWERQPV